MSTVEVNFRKQPKGFATKALHVGQDPEQWTSQCVIPPLVTSTTYKQMGPAEHKGFEYSRSGNPTRNVLEQCLASLDGGKHGLTFASGLGATTTVTGLLSAGDHIICSDDVYGGTNRLLNQITVRQGIEVTLVDVTEPEKIRSAIKKSTKLVWIETPTNPMMKLADIKKISSIVHAASQDIIVAVDNTFLSPYFQRPLEFGADMVMYSLTKYVNGHSDVVMGAVVLNDDKLHQRLRFLQNAMGVVPAPFDCYQVNRSIKTLQLRMEQHFKNGVAVAKFLEEHALVETVFHPALPSHPHHALALRQCYGHSGIFSFYLKGGLAESRKFLQSLKIFILAESLGGYESLAELPSLMTHASVPEAQRVQLGISDNLIRLSVGLEDAEDLIEDLDQALKATQNL